MGAMFRSEEMALSQLFIQPEAAYFAISELGESGCVQFRDVSIYNYILTVFLIISVSLTFLVYNYKKVHKHILLQLNENVNAFQRKFVTEVRRCDEMERKLRYIEAEVKKDGVNVPDVHELPKAPNPREIIDLEVR